MEFKYSERPPVAHRANSTDTVEHQVGIKVRRMLDRPGDTVSIKVDYSVYCSCGWRDERWLPRRAATRAFEGHLGDSDAF